MICVNKIMSIFAQCKILRTDKIMRKITLLSMIALLAVSCSNDIELIEPEQFDNQTQAQPTSVLDANGIISRSVSALDDEMFWKSGEVYGSFFHNLLTKNPAAFIVPISNASAKDFGQVYKFDISKLSGKFTAGKYDWSYAPSDKLEFDFVDIDSTDCSLEVSMGESAFTLARNQHFSLSFPNSIKSELFFDGAPIAGDSISYKGQSAYFERSAGNLRAFGELKSGDKYTAQFEIFNGGENVINLKAESETLMEDATWTIELGDTLSFEVKTSVLDEFIAILMANDTINEASEAGRASVQELIDDFNSYDMGNPAKFYYTYILNGVETKGQVVLVMCEPGTPIGYDVVKNEPIVTDEYFIGIGLADKNKVTFVSAPVLKTVVAVREFVEMVINEICIQIDRTLTCIHNRIAEFVNNVETFVEHVRTCIYETIDFLNDFPKKKVPGFPSFRD